MKRKRMFGICLGLVVAAGVCLVAGRSKILPQDRGGEKMMVASEELPIPTPDGLAGKEGNAATAAQTPNIESRQPDAATTSPPLPQAAGGPVVAGLKAERECTPSANIASDSAPVPASVRIEMAALTTTEEPCSTEMSQQSTAVPAEPRTTEAPAPTPEKSNPTSTSMPTSDPPAPAPIEATAEAPAETPQLTPEPLPAPEQTPEPAFDIAGWISFAQDYAVSVGLNLDPTATACWDAPIVAGAHRADLAADIQSRLARYARDETILDVWIWSAPRGDGTFDLYIGYA